MSKSRMNPEFQHLRPDNFNTQRTTQKTTSYPPTVHGLRPTYEVHSTNDQIDGDRQLLQHPGEFSQRSSFSRSTHFEPERPIPSVERDSHAPESEEQYVEGNESTASQRHFQKHFVGPRIVELDDGSTSPDYKRQRTAYDAKSVSKVTYSTASDQGLPVLVPLKTSIGLPGLEHGIDSMSPSEARWYSQGTPRRTELVPITGRGHHVPSNGPMRDFIGGDVQHRTGLITKEYHVPGAFPEMRPEYQQHTISPSLHSQSRFPEEAPASGAFPSFHSGTRLLPKVHEPSRSLRPVYTSSVTTYAEEHRSDNRSRPFVQHTEHGYREVPSRPKLPYPADHNTRADAHARPVASHVYGDRGNERPLVAEAENLTLRAPLQNREHGSNLFLYPQASKLDCPMALRGSFCNRFMENGFTRKDHLVEHMRNVHRLDATHTKETDEAPLGRPLAPPGGRWVSRSADIHSKERQGDRLESWQRIENYKTDREGEVVYISSSPLVEQR